MFLLRENQQDDAREQYGRLAEPLTFGLAALAAEGGDLDDLRAFVDQRSLEYGARILLLDQEQVVIHDTDATDDDGLEGRYVLAFEGSDVRTTSRAACRYEWAQFNSFGAEAHDVLVVGTARLTRSSPAPQYQAVIADPTAGARRRPGSSSCRGCCSRARSRSTVSFIVSYFISRSISGRCARITAASKQMAQGNYDVYIPIKGEDEVGKLSEAFNQMAQQVSTSQRTMKDLLANVSHELKTPLTSIQGFSQAILDDVVTEEQDIKDYSRLVYEEAQRMRGLVDDLLLLSQIESGQVLMEHRRVDMAQLLEHSMERFQWSIKEAGIESGVYLERLPDVIGDSRRLEQVFSNLLQNAVRHTPQGGLIAISAKTIAGGHVSISVHNTGSYIPKEDIARVFERFFQVDRARTRKGGSSGLGLSIVNEIVEAHGGTVRAVSSEERGTEFIVVLPNANSPEARARRAATAAAAHEQTADTRTAASTPPRRTSRPDRAVVR